MVGRTISHYRVLKQLGAGGMGEVYLADDRRLHRKVALKVLPADLAASPERLARFKREAELLASLDHPNIVTIHSVDRVDGIHFLTMALVEGRTLDEVVPPGGLPLERFLGIAVPLADAVAAAHERGITHRDLKPKNIMITDEGRVKVLDFGVAKLHPQSAGPDETAVPTLTMTAEGAVVGTVPYMSPEQLQGTPVDARSDVFSLGIILYEMATGRSPFQGQTAATVVSSILRDTPSPVTERRRGLPRHLGRIVHECLEKDPGRRFQSAVELRNQLEIVRDEAQAERLSRVHLPAPSEWLPATLRARLVAGAALAALALAAVVLVYRASAPSLPVTPLATSLAVLPLENLSGDAAQEYFADGLTEALTTDLARIGGLERVIARTSVMGYKGGDTPLVEIGDALGVEALVTGSVLRQGDRVQVTAQLLAAPFEQVLWSERYQREMEDMLSLQNEIIGEIVRGVEVQLAPREATALARRESVDPDAYDAVLRGDYLRSVYAVQEAVAAYREALEHDVGHAPAYLGLAEAYRVMGLNAMLASREAHGMARAAVAKALELDQENAAAHVTRAMLAFQFGWDREGADAAFERARELDPEVLIGHLGYSWVLVVSGRFEEGIAVVEEAVARDPLNPQPLNELVWSNFTAGRHRESLRVAETLYAMAPPMGLLQKAWNLAAMDRGPEALAIVRPYLEEELPQFFVMTLTWLLAEAGEPGLARQQFERLRSLGETTWVDPVYLAVGHAVLEEFGTALDQLERGLEERSVSMIFLKTTPAPPLLDVLDPLRGEPRFQTIVERIGPESTS